MRLGSGESGKASGLYVITRARPYVSLDCFDDPNTSCTAHLTGRHRIGLYAIETRGRCNKPTHGPGAAAARGRFPAGA